MSPTDAETCSKCGQLLPSSQQACVFEGMIVCAECDKILRRKQTSQPAPIQPVRSQRTRSVWFVAGSCTSIVFAALLKSIRNRRTRPVWVVAGICAFVVFVALLKSNGGGGPSKGPGHDSHNTSIENEKKIQQSPLKSEYIEIRKVLPSAVKEIPLSLPNGKTIVEKGIGQENVRVGPGMNYASDNTGTLEENEKLYVLEEKNGWIRFRVTSVDCKWSAWINKDLTISEKELHDAHVAKFGEPPQKGPWGSIRCVKEYLNATARDPESLKFEKWSDIFYSEDGWLVLCEFRAKNGFGGYNREAKWFVIQYGRVVDVKNFDVYK